MTVRVASSLMVALLVGGCTPFGDGSVPDASVPELDGGSDAAAASDASPDASVCPNGALSFTEDSFVNVPASASLDPPGALTVEAWILPDASIGTDESHIVSHHDHTTSDGYVLMLFGRLKLRVYSGAAAGQMSEVSSNANVPLGVWHHVAGVFDPSAQQMRVYLDGRRVGAATTPRVRPEPYSGPLRIGIASYAYGFPYAGIIDEVRVSAAARYTADFTPAYPLPDAEPSTIATWHFTEQAGSTATSADQSLIGTLGSRPVQTGNTPPPIPTWNMPASCPRP